ncbi:TIGR00341 family protein [Demequina lignilytica]|uniref:TIGR00341 family protein n=1 Tax=Demequina lignilytica TaxID=3051663 RepID=A0AB35MFM2_9MICO|nr:TIGR00341 family protein [Demequina sp. SYSU T0a273]MDN4482570.1 TIGR00341 family protein [Demequina sp. SYSU T0a273]
MTAASTPRETRWGAKLNTVDYMRDAVFFDGPTVRSQTTRFWLLLLLASAIASAGVIANSTATVIGAMIVAPLMRPIQGTMLATVLGDHRNLTRSITMMVAGAGAAVGVGFVMGLMLVQPIVAETNDQVAGRVSPGLIDLLAALATGLVGSVALLRSDISDTLPGVAIAISLVPPLCVVGLTLESGAYGQAFGALLLFVTNVAAILATGSVTMAVYGFAKVRIEMAEDKEAERRRRARAYLTTMVMLLVVAVPLTYSTVKTLEDRSRMGQITSYVENVTAGTRWTIVSITPREEDRLHVIVKGEPPLPDMAAVYADMEANGLDIDKISIELIPSYTYDSEHLEAPETVG